MDTDLLTAFLATAVLVCITFFIYWTYPLTRALVSFPTACAIAVLIAAKPSKLELLSSICLGFVFAPVYLHSHELSYDIVPGAEIVNVLSFWGAGAVIMLAWRAVRRPRKMDSFLLAIAGPTLMVVLRLALALMPARGQSVDYNIYDVDVGLGIPLWRLTGQMFSSHPVVAGLCSFIYCAILPVQVLVFMLFLKGSRPMAANPFITIPVAGVLGFLLYQCCPASGPLYAFGPNFARVTSETAPINWATLAHAPRNAVPSLHAAWAFIAFWSTKGYGVRIRTAMLSFALLTLVATLGTGEHYVTDLIVALPFAVSIQAMGERVWGWALNMAVTILFCFYIRFGLSAAINPWIPAGLAILVSGTCLMRGAMGYPRSTQVLRQAPS